MKRIGAVSEPDQFPANLARLSTSPLSGIMSAENDEELQSSIKHYVMQNMKRSEVFDFLKRHYPEYAWSLPTLDRRMSYFNMKYIINYETTVDEVVAGFNIENDGPWTTPWLSGHAQKSS